MKRWGILLGGAMVAACGSILGVDPLTVDQQAAPSDDAGPLIDAGPAIIDAATFPDVAQGAVCQHTGFVTPAAVVTVGDGNIWNALSNMESDSDGADAIGLSCCNGNTQAVRATNFGLAIPKTAQIQGVTIRLKARSEPGTTWVDDSIKFVSGETLGAELKVTTPWPTGDDDDYDDRTYGSELSLGGLPLTPDLVNTPDFGVQFSEVEPNGARANANFLVDVVGIVVFYCE